VRRSLIAAFAALLTAAAFAQDAPVILEYHEADPMPERGWAVSTDNFRDQMEYLAKADYNVIPISDVVDYVNGRRGTLPSNAVVITIDDGWQCAYTEMAPLLKQFGFPWSLYAYPRIVGHGSHALSWPQIETLAKSGVDVEGHTTSHAHLTRKSHPDLSDEQYDAFLRGELDESKQVIESHTGHPVHVISYPYSEYDNVVTAAAKRAGYDAGLVGWMRPNTRNTDPMKLGRLKIVSGMSLDQFRTALGAVPIMLRDALPAAGDILPREQKTLSASIDDQQLDPASVRATFLSNTPSEASYDPGLHRVTLSSKEGFREERQTVLVQAITKDGRRAAGIWTFYTSAQARSRYDAMATTLSKVPLQDDATEGR
jgi:peptidoglycan/xylan/chitin deacetylase (PgdA/CDA1 family)